MVPCITSGNFLFLLSLLYFYVFLGEGMEGEFVSTDYCKLLIRMSVLYIMFEVQLFSYAFVNAVDKVAFLVSEEISLTKEVCTPPTHRPQLPFSFPLFP